MFDPKMNKAEAQFNRVRSSADTDSSERRADSVQKSRKAPGRATHFERRVQTKEKTRESSRERLLGNSARRASPSMQTGRYWVEACPLTTRHKARSKKKQLQE